MTTTPSSAKALLAPSLLALVTACGGGGTAAPGPDPFPPGNPGPDPDPPVTAPGDLSGTWTVSVEVEESGFGGCALPALDGTTVTLTRAPSGPEVDFYWLDSASFASESPYGSTVAAAAAIGGSDLFSISGHYYDAQRDETVNMTGTASALHHADATATSTSFLAFVSFDVYDGDRRVVTPGEDGFPVHSVDSEAFSRCQGVAKLEGTRDATGRSVEELTLYLPVHASADALVLAPAGRLPLE